MIRWFRNFGALFKKPRGLGTVKTEPTNHHSQRVETVSQKTEPEVLDGQEDRRSLGGKGGGGGGGGHGGGGHGGGHGGGGHGGGGHGGGRSSGHSHGGHGRQSGSHGEDQSRSIGRGSSGYSTQTKSSGRTGSSASTNNSKSMSTSRASRSTTRSSRNSMGRSNTRSASTSTTASQRNYSTTSSTRSTKSTKSTASTIPPPTSSGTYSQKSRKSSSGYSTSSVETTGSASRGSSVSSQMGTVSTKSAKNTTSTTTGTSNTASIGRSRGRSKTRRDNINSVASQRSRSWSRGRARSINNPIRSVSPGKSTKGPHVSRKDAAMKEVLSPTNRASQLNRSLSAHHENAYHQRKNTPNGVWNEMFPHGTLVMYTDGSYLRRQHRSGIGIFVAPGHELNRSQGIRGNIQDNNFAEFVAIKTALQNALKNETYKNQKVIIRTDCLNVIEALSGARGTQYPHLKTEVIELSKQFPKGVDFQHVYAHEGDPGNEIADMFAGIATGKAQGVGGDGFRRNRSASRERNRQRSKSNDPAMIRSRSHSIQGRN